MAAKDNYYTIQSIGKTFEVIEAMSLQPEWELAELSRHTGLPKTTVHRFLLTLEELGYVSQRKERGGYSLTFKFAHLGNKVVNNSDLADTARPYCIALRDSLDETVNLCSQSGTEMLVMDRQQSRQLLRQDSIVGSSFSCFHSASGRAFMAFMEEERLGKLLDNIRLQSKGAITAKDMQNLKELLLQARKSCVGYDFEEVFPGVRCIASPIFDQKKKVVATVGISAPTVRLNDAALETASREVRDAAMKISNSLGAPSYPYAGE